MSFSCKTAISTVHKLAKLMLEQAGTFIERSEAIEVAMRMGMSLNQIEEYLDWLDNMDKHPRGGTTDDRSRQ